MKATLLVFTLLLTACGGAITRAEIEKATELCSKNDGIQRLHLGGAGDIQAICTNGATFYFTLRN